MSRYKIEKKRKRGKEETFNIKLSGVESQKGLAKSYVAEMHRILNVAVIKWPCTIRVCTCVVKRDEIRHRVGSAE